ncbi:MAG: alpha-amylase family glycosyl hydrolase [Cellulosilyticaceae bacterium]
MVKISRGLPILGCHLKADGANFGIFSDRAESMLLNIYEKHQDLEPIISVWLTEDDQRTGDIFHVFIEGIKAGMAYEWKVFKNKKMSIALIDPYAYSVREISKGKNIYRNIVVALEPYTHRKPCIQWEDTIIYEMHVSAFTKHPSSNVQHKGTFLGIQEKLGYLKELGITTIELLPIFKWNKYTLKHTHPITGEKMQDVWGYNTIAFFALQDEYSWDQSVLGEIKEFRTLVENIHEQGMEVILDVVYNHTGEGGEHGSLFNFKELGNDTYYKMDKANYMNCSGTGNTLNTAHIVVKQLILESLRYWVVYMGVDGFRFDLASILGQDENGNWYRESLLKDISEDPILSKVKLISESWDAKGNYDVGKMPYPFVEWSDCFRDTMRKFIRGDMGITQDVVRCMMGEEVTHIDERKTQLNNLHFVTAHDGFTLWDLVSYLEKHNEINGENNQDGNNANHSENCGVEGETENLEILKLRKRKVRNYMLMLILSKGVPMLLMGDELGRTQKGNNNAYCQDNEILWVDWEKGKKFENHYKFMKEIIKLKDELKTLIKRNDSHISWHGINYNEPDWSYHSRSLAYHIESKDVSYYIIANNYVESLSFELPYIESGWERVIDTYEESNRIEVFNTCYTVNSFSLCVFKSRNA